MLGEILFIILCLLIICFFKDIIIMIIIISVIAVISIISYMRYNESNNYLDA